MYEGLDLFLIQRLINVCYGRRASKHPLAARQKRLHRETFRGGNLLRLTPAWGQNRPTCAPCISVLYPRLHPLTCSVGHRYATSQLLCLDITQLRRKASQTTSIDTRSSIGCHGRSFWRISWLFMHGATSFMLVGVFCEERRRKKLVRAAGCDFQEVHV